MLQSMEEFNAASGQVINGIDNPSLFSVDSTTPVVTDADGLPEFDENSKEFVEPEVKTPAGEVKVEVEKEPEVLKPESKDAVQKRIDEITKKRRIAERERDYERTKRLEAEQKLAELAKSVPPTDKPIRADFEDDDSYIEALSTWTVERKLKEAQEKVVTETTNVEEKAAVEEVYRDLDSVLEQGREKYTDFNELVLHEDLVLSPKLTEIILESDADIALELFYYLGNNPDESERLSRLAPEKAEREIGKLEVKLLKEGPAKQIPASEQEGEEEVSPKAEKLPEVKLKKLPSAPEPINPVRQTGATDRDPSQMTPKEYRAWRERNR